LPETNPDENHITQPLIMKVISQSTQFMYAFKSI